MAGDPEQLELIAPARPVRRVRKAADLTIRALRKTGCLEDVDSLLVAVVRTNADRCDELRGVEGKEFHESQALRLQLDAETRLRSLRGPTDDAFDRFLAEATGPAPPGNPA